MRQTTTPKKTRTVLPPPPPPPPYLPPPPPPPVSTQPPVVMRPPVMVQPPVVVQPAPVAPQAPVVRGDLRVGYVGSMRQRIVEAVVGVAVATSMFTTLLGFSGTDTFLFGTKDGGLYEARPGIWFFFVPIIAVTVGIRHLAPRGWFNAGYRMRLKARYGISALYKKSGVLVRVIVSTFLWALGLILASAFVARILDDGYDLKPGAYLIILSSIVGLLATPFILPGRDNPEVRVDDAGQVFQ